MYNIKFNLKSILSVFLILFCHNLNAQNIAIQTLSINPTPATLAENATEFGFKVLNDDTLPISYNTFNPVKVNVSTSKFIPDVDTAPTGPGMEYFDWRWSCSANCDLDSEGNYPDTAIFTLELTQNKIIPGQPDIYTQIGGRISFFGTALETLKENITQYNGVGMNINAVINKNKDLDINDNVGSRYTFTEESDAVVAPVLLNEFSATANGNDSVLNWSTASENNNSHFEIERSKDGINFSKIGEVSGSGTVSTESKYSFVNESASFFAETVYYRLNQIDFDGTSSDLGIRSVEFSGVFKEAMIYPNPVNYGNTIYIKGDDIKNVEIYNLTGDLIQSLDNQNSDLVSIETTDFTKGTYIAIVGSEKIKFVVK